MIILDLEWYRLKTKRGIVPEIVQIGAVKVNNIGGPIIDSFSVYVKPTADNLPQDTLSLLPNIQMSLESKTAFPDAYTAFLEWAGEDRVIAEWGCGDIRALNVNCRRWSLPALKPIRTLDLQKAFSMALTYELGKGISLANAVEYLQLPSVFCFHDALNDAVYTALVAECLGEKRAFARKPPKIEDLPRTNFELHTKKHPIPRWRNLGPYATMEDAVFSEEARTPLCPICKGKTMISAWVWIEDRNFHGLAHCLKHGKFCAQMYLRYFEDRGAWHGSVRIVQTKPRHKRLLEPEPNTCLDARKRPNTR